MRHSAIIGAGISGLSLAWHLQKQGERVTLFEKSSRAGGHIRTLQHEGFLFELGPRSFRAQKEIMQLIEELDLTEQLITASGDRYLYVDQKLQKLPNSLFTFLTSPLTRRFIPRILAEWKQPKGTHDESVFDFASRRYGKEMAERFFNPLLTGIYAGDYRKLSIRSCLPTLYQMEQTHGSLLRGMFSQKKTPIYTFKKGMETLTHELAKRLPINYNTEVTALNFSDFDHIYSTIPSHAISQLLPLPEVPTVSIATVSLGFHRPVLKYKGFGYLVPSIEKEKVLGVVWDSSAFPDQTPNQTRLTVMIGETYMHEDLQNIALEALSKHLGIDAKPDAIYINRIENAIPQYHVGHQEMLEKMSLPPHFTLLGNSFYGVSVPDCILASCKKRILKLHSN